MRYLRFLFKKTVCIFLLFSISSLVLSSEDQGKPTLRIANWSEYLLVDDKVPSTASWVEKSPLIKQFTEQCNCEVDYQEYDSTQEILIKLEQIPNYYDVVVVSSGDVTRLLKGGLLDTIDQKQLENFDPANYSGFQRVTT